jgi:hypothetical protein
MVQGLKETASQTEERRKEHILTEHRRRQTYQSRSFNKRWNHWGPINDSIFLLTKQGGNDWQSFRAFHVISDKIKAPSSPTQRLPLCCPGPGCVTWSTDVERSRSSASPVLSGLENVTLVMPLTRTAEISFTLLTPLMDVSGQTPVDTPPLAEHWAWKKDKAKRGKGLDNRKVGSYVFVRVLESGTKEL